MGSNPIGSTNFVLFNPIAKTSLTERERARRSSSKMASGPSRSFTPPSRYAVASRSASRWQKRTKRKRARLQSSIQTSLKTWKKLSSTASLGTRQRGNSPRSFRDSTLNSWTIKASLRSRHGSGYLVRNIYTRPYPLRLACRRGPFSDSIAGRLIPPKKSPDIPPS